MNVPAVVQMTCIMIALSATLGPANQSHQDRPSTWWSARAEGGLSMSQRPSPLPSRWIRPRESANQVGPLIPIASRPG